jgi:ATP-binding cassette subfamily B protein
MVSMMFVMVPRAAASANRINEVLDTAPDISDPVQATGDRRQATEPATGERRTPHATRGARQTGQEPRSSTHDPQPTSRDVLPPAASRLPPGRGFVTFEHVTFRYPGAEQPALSDISFHARPGEVTAIIGGTGSGKSTLVNLIPRFYDVDSGRILVDGVDVREMAQADLRARIGFVPQKTALFTGAIADNIRYGKEDATDQEVARAADTAQATEFISGMAEGFGSWIAQGGSNVSGGQKQRLSIARALVRMPEIYIFDDSFSALDFKTDARLRAALKRETADATVLLVAQRVATVMDADRIIVLDEGHMIGMGTHRELMASCTVYREIVASQLSEEEIA